MPPHSKTVRGTLDNPKTKDAIAHNKLPPQTVDPTSLSRGDSVAKTPSDHPTNSSANGNGSEENGFGIPADTYGLKDKESAPSAPSSFERRKESNGERNHGDNYGLDKGKTEKEREGAADGQRNMASGTKWSKL